MALTLHFDETFAQSPDVVFAAFHPDQLANWMPGFIAVEYRTEPPMAVGSLFRQTRKVGGRTATEQFEVKAYEPGKHLRLWVDGTKGSTQRGWFDFEYRFEPDKYGGTTMTVVGSMGGFGLVMELVMKLFMSKIMRLAITRDHQALRQWLDETENKS
jgi:uncharacterized protein YndB with AHSA1/START domain